MTTASTTCREIWGKTWLSSLSSAIARSKSLRTADKRSSTNYTVNINCRRESICQTLTLHSGSMCPNFPRHKKLGRTLTRPNRHKSRHRMKRLGRRETRLSRKFARSSPASRRTSLVHLFAEPSNSLRPELAIPATPANFLTDLMRNTGSSLRRMVSLFPLHCSSTIKLIRLWQEFSCLNFQTASAMLKILLPSCITI